MKFWVKLFLPIRAASLNPRYRRSHGLCEWHLLDTTFIIGWPLPSSYTMKNNWSKSNWNAGNDVGLSSHSNVWNLISIWPVSWDPAGITVKFLVPRPQWVDHRRFHRKGKITPFSRNWLGICARLLKHQKLCHVIFDQKCIYDSISVRSIFKPYCRPTNIPSQLKALGNGSQLGDAAEALKVEPPSSRRQKNLAWVKFFRRSDSSRKPKCSLCAAHQPAPCANIWADKIYSSKSTSPLLVAVEWESAVGLSSKQICLHQTNCGIWQIANLVQAHDRPNRSDHFCTLGGRTVQPRQWNLIWA